MYITDYVDNTKYGQSSVMDFAGYLWCVLQFVSGGSGLAEIGWRF